MTLSAKTLLDIYTYWNFKDGDINRYTIHQKIKKLFEDNCVPEYDYQADWSDVFKIKKAGISK